MYICTPEVIQSKKSLLYSVRFFAHLSTKNYNYHLKINIITIHSICIAVNVYSHFKGLTHVYTCGDTCIVMQLHDICINFSKAYTHWYQPLMQTDLRHYVLPPPDADTFILIHSLTHIATCILKPMFWWMYHHLYQCV